MKNPKVVVVTPGRFHSVDLAEQLQGAGRLAAIYTGYPRFKLRNTGVEPRLIRSFPWLQTPYMVGSRFQHFPQRMLAEIAWQSNELIDAYAARTLPECGLVSALSASGLKAGAEIQRRGGIYVCDRGSTHILWQQRILQEEYRRLGLPWHGIDPRVVEKEQAEYALCDAITLPSLFAMQSFIEMGIPMKKLRHVPYGVNLSAYKRSTKRTSNFRVLFVGQLSVRKGLHYLLDAFNRAALPGSELVLVGGRTPDTEALLKRHPVERLIMPGLLPREGVAQEMSRASVMVLPSIEDGFGLVQAQALSCGCPVIATTHTGAEDLFEDGREGFIVPPRDVAALTEKLTRLYHDPDLLTEMSAAAIPRVMKLGGWDTYGRKMMAVFDDLLGAGHERGTPAVSQAGRNSMRRNGLPHDIRPQGKL
jgi:glycosyltransferase involved in cell wall biosynthesis